MRSIVTILAIAGAALAFGDVARGALEPTPAQIDAQCRPYYHEACSEALGKWLPGFGFSSDWWDMGARHVRARDSFSYEGSSADRDGGKIGYRGPLDGTFFVYGSAGPPKGRVVYDPEHRIAFYFQGCCSWQDVVLAAEVSVPPKAVVLRDLRAVVTARGIPLWQTPTEVRAIDGPAPMLAVAGHPDVSVLSYTTWRPKNDVHMVHGYDCGQFQNFFFRSGRLVLIQLGNGC